MKVWLGLAAVLAVGHRWSPPAPDTIGPRRPICCARSLATRTCAAACWSNGASRACWRRRWSARCSGWAARSSRACSAIRWPSLICWARPAARRWAPPSRCWCRSRCRSRSSCRCSPSPAPGGPPMLVIGISRVVGAVDAAGMLLAGVAVAAILGALRSFLMLALSDETVSLQVVLSWVLGGVQTPTWRGVGLLAVITLACLALTMLLAGKLDVLGLGETMATAFGLERQSLRAVGGAGRLGDRRRRGRLRRPRRLRRVWPRRISRAGWSDRCIGRCCRPRRWSARSSSRWPTRSPARPCRRPRFRSGW